MPMARRSVVLMPDRTVYDRHAGCGGCPRLRRGAERGFGHHAWIACACVAVVACGRAAEIAPPPPDIVGDSDEEIQPPPVAVVESQERYELEREARTLDHALAEVDTQAWVDTGTPRYDNAADQPLIPDLDFDLHTASLLVRGFAFLNDDRLRELLRHNARFPVHGQLDRLRQLAVKGINRNLTEGVALVATLDRVEDVRVRATRDALMARADASGSLQLQIARPVAVGRAGASRRTPPGGK